MRAGAPASPISESRARLPQIRSRECGAEHARYELAVPGSLAWFAGHFPGHPVLPGVAQVGWAAHFAREAFDFAGDPLGMDRVKFLHPVRPGTTMGLELVLRGAGGNRVEWRFARADVVFSRGRFEFAGRAAERP